MGRLPTLQPFFADPSFWQLFRNTFVLAVYNLVFFFPMPIILALLLNEIRRETFKRTIQTFVYLPHFISWPVVVGLCYVILSTSDGFINQLLVHFGFPKISFLTDSHWFRTLITLQVIWKETGWGTVIFLASLAGIDPALYEAARMDGANRWQQMRHIKFPALLSTIVIMLILRLGNFLDSGFEQIFLMLTSSTRDVGEVFDTYVYSTGLANGQLSYATAIGLFKSVISLVLVLIANFTAKKWDKRRTIKMEQATLGNRVYTAAIYGVLSIVGLLSFLPFPGSFVSEKELLTHAIVLIPTQISLSTYKYIFSSNVILHSLGVSVMIVFTMLFGGGIIPTYLVVKQLGLLGTYFSQWLPTAISAFNLILLKNCFQQLPEEIEESAKIDGYNDMQILWKIAIPLSLPAMATFALFYAVTNWNSYFNAILYLDNMNMWPIQVWLRQIIILASGGFTDASAIGEEAKIPPEAIKLAVIVVATVPILLIYPFLQKYFAKGILLGSVKG